MPRLVQLVNSLSLTGDAQYFIDSHTGTMCEGIFIGGGDGGADSGASDGGGNGMFSWNNTFTFIC